MSSIIKLISDDPTILGRLNDLPNVETNTIRYLSDMIVERNELMSITFPRLQQYFNGRGFDFQVVDMGLRDESVLDHQASDLWLQEIKNAQNISRGICFMALLGDKYGSCPIITVLSQKEFQILKTYIGLTNNSTDLLDEWYSLDQNACPPHYVLHRSTKKFKKINSIDIDDFDERAEQRKQWNKVQNDLRHLLQVGAEDATSYKQFSEAEKYKFVTSVIEREVAEGILSDEFASERTLCFLRQFKNLNPMDAMAGRYMDITEGKLDQKRSSFIHRLKSEKLSEKLPDENIFKYSVNWTASGMHPTLYLEHKAYLAKLCDDVYDSVVSFSERRITTTELESSLSGEMILLHQELQHHARFCTTKANSYVARQSLEDSCRRYILENKFNIPDPTCPLFWAAPFTMTDTNVADSLGLVSQEEAQVENMADINALGNLDDAGQIMNLGRNMRYHVPFIIDAPSGFGKTLLMAKLSKLFGSDDKWIPSKNESETFSEWLSRHDVLKIIRFLGSSPGSCGIRDVIISIIQQLWGAFGSPENAKEIQSPRYCANYSTITVL